MSKLWITLGAIGLVLLVAYGTAVGTYNGLVTKRQATETSWAQVETQYQRRYDLIPNLVSATQGFLTQEQKVFGEIAEARTHYAGTQPGSDERVQATGQVESALARLMVIVENYPQLNSNQTVRDLMTELAGTENRIGVARQRYNEVTQEYDVSLKRFPTNLFANVFGFEERPLFKSDQAAAKAPEVKLNQ